MILKLIKFKKIFKNNYNDISLYISKLRNDH